MNTFDVYLFLCRKIQLIDEFLTILKIRKSISNVLEKINKLKYLNDYFNSEVLFKVKIMKFS